MYEGENIDRFGQVVIPFSAKRVKCLPGRVKCVYFDKDNDSHRNDTGMTQSNCTSCNAALPANAKFCPGCGAAIGRTAMASNKSTGLRDTLIVVGALVVVAAGFFIFRKGEPKPEPPVTEQTAGGQHPPVTDPSGMPSEMPQLANLPTDYAGLVDVGNHKMDAGDYALAAECYRRALAIDGSNANVRTDYGACLHGMGLPQRALDEFRKVLAQDAMHTICIFNMGVIFADMKQKDSAKFYWNRYLQMDPHGSAAEAAQKLLKDLDSL